MLNKQTPRQPLRTRPVTATAVSAALIATLTLAAGCSNSSHPHATSSTHPSTDPSQTTTTSTTGIAARPSTTVQGPTGPPADYPAARPTPPSLAGAYPTGTTVNLVTVIKTLTTYEDWVWSHPDPALVANYEVSTGNAYTDETRTIAEFQKEGLHASPTPAEIDFVKVTRQAIPQVSATAQPSKVGGYVRFLGGVITVVYNLKPIPMFLADDDASGQSFNPSTPGPAAFVVSLIQAPDGQFLVNDSNQFSPAGGIAALEGGE